MPLGALAPRALPRRGRRARLAPHGAVPQDLNPRPFGYGLLGLRVAGHIVDGVRHAGNLVGVGIGDLNSELLLKSHDLRAYERR